MMDIIAKALMELDLCIVASNEKITVDFSGDQSNPARKFIFMVNEIGFDMYVMLEYNPGITLEIANQFNAKIKYGNFEIWNDDQVVFKLSMPTEVTGDLIKKCFVIAMSAMNDLLGNVGNEDENRTDFFHIQN
ncbi:MAG: hypothetical protein HQM12_14785 [SAR324 cluster bacterium]|nr:hypothetical protein [SAR324 cluster bacterium]